MVNDVSCAELRTQVLIVGGGPSGLGLALELARHGVRCVLVERHECPQPIPKGQNLTQRTLEHFHFWGAEQALRAARSIPPEYGIGGVTAYGSLLGGYTYDWLQRDLVRPFYYTANERLPQYATEAVLRGQAAQMPTITTLYGWNVEELGQDALGITARAVQRGNQSALTIRADYCVGCDGSRSNVRDWANITQTRSDHDRLMVLLVFRSTELHRLLQVFPGKSYYNVLHPQLRGYWQFFGRVDLGTTWFFHAPVPMGTTRENFDFAGLLHRAVGAEFALELEYVGFWDLRVATADTYRNRRIFIAGDAAHSHPPYGGYGINTGLEDAVNLGWKLAAVLHGWGAEALLDSYSDERRPVFLSTAHDFIEKAIRNDREFLEDYDPGVDREIFERKWSERSAGARSEVRSFEPHYEGSPIVWGSGGDCSAVGSHEFIARAGHHLAPFVMPSGRNVYEELGKHFTLVDFQGHPECIERMRRSAQERALPLKILSESCPSGLEHYGAAQFLVRPDQFVAWVASDGDFDAGPVLDRVVGR